MQNLLSCDLDPYDERYFLSPSAAAKLLVGGHAVPCKTPSACNCDRRGRQHAPPSPPSSSAEGSPPSGPRPSTALPAPPDLSSLAGDDAQTPAMLIDLRPSESYTRSHVRGARNVPLTEPPTDLFGDAKAVEERWWEMRQAVDGPLWPGPGELQDRRVVVVCRDGQSATMAVAMLRAGGLEAFSVEGGYRGLLCGSCRGVMDGE